MTDRYVVQFDPKRGWRVWDTQAPGRAAAMDRPVWSGTSEDAAINRASALNDPNRWPVARGRER